MARVPRFASQVQIRQKKGYCNNHCKMERLHGVVSTNAVTVRPFYLEWLALTLVVELSQPQHCYIAFQQSPIQGWRCSPGG